MKLSKLLRWADRYPYFYFLLQNDPQENVSLYRWVVGVGHTPHKGPLTPGNWYFGGWRYEWGSNFEKSPKSPWIDFPYVAFFQPHIVIAHEEAPDWSPEDLPPLRPTLRYLQASLDRRTFEGTVEVLRQHIYNGEVYQVNLTTAFLWEGTIDPVATYLHLLHHNPTLYNYLFKWRNRYVIGASPERFCLIWRNIFAQQPIKGTARRGQTLEEDIQLMLNLRKNPKEIAENTMIVDMVRNNFYRFCEPESVVVYRWGAVHTYPGVHHLVSGVSGQKRSDVDLVEGIQAIFPAASMTGAPQQAAQRFIEQYEPIARGIYSGALGYLTPESEGDFAVVIRSWVYDTRSKKLLLQVGSGITYDSQPRAEWEETLLKAHRHIQSLGLPTPLITP